MKYLIAILVPVVGLVGVWFYLGGGDGEKLQTQENEEVVLGANDDGVMTEENVEVVTPSISEGEIKAQVWADNWFSLYANGVFIGEDSVSINTERSFNQETFGFNATYPVQLAFVVKDYKQNDTGLEYIDTVRQQMGDGGFIAQFTQGDQIVGVTNSEVKCEVVHYAPVNKACENVAKPSVGISDCGFIEKGEPDGWKTAGFDDSSWSKATEYSEAAVDPKDGYDEVNWNSEAKLIWGSDLEQDNTLLCRMILKAPEGFKAKEVSTTQTSLGNSANGCPVGVDGATVSCTSEQIVIESDGLPSHTLMTGILNGGWNGQWPSKQDYTGSNAFFVTRNPVLQSSPQTTMKNTAGVTVNGIPVFLPQAPGQAGSDDCLNIDISGDVYHEHECARDPVAAGEMDVCGGHTGRGDDYHYHAEPTCLMEQIPNTEVVGYMMDGFPIYTDPIVGSTAYAGCGGYLSPGGEIHYAFTSEFPYVTNCLLGEVSEGPRTSGSDVYTGSINAKNSGSIIAYGTNTDGCLYMNFSSGASIVNCSVGGGSSQGSQIQGNTAPEQNTNEPGPEGVNEGQRKYCGDGICDNTESESQCAADCS